MAKYQIAILVGSLREGSINRRIGRSICAMEHERLDCRIVEIGDLPLYNQDYDGNSPESYERFRNQIRDADGVLFVTPEYNRGVPGVLKNAVDVGSRPYGSSVWAQKPAAIVSASPGAIGGFGANHQLRQACVFLNMPVMQHPESYLGNVNEEDFGTDGLLKEGRTEEFVRTIADAFADWVHLIHEARSLLAR